MGKILTEISQGELLDKLSILEIKLKEIKDELSLKEVKKEHTILSKIKTDNIENSEIIDDLFKKLKSINEKIWKSENIKRNYEKRNNFDEEFIKISREEYKANDERAMIKSKINHILDSNIKEVKQHVL